MLSTPLSCVRELALDHLNVLSDMFCFSQADCGGDSIDIRLHIMGTL